MSHKSCEYAKAVGCKVPCQKGEKRNLCAEIFSNRTWATMPDATETSHRSGSDTADNGTDVGKIFEETRFKDEE